MQCDFCPHDEKVGHAVVVVGIKDDAWVIKNSWGPSWANSGFCHIRRDVNIDEDFIDVDSEQVERSGHIDWEHAGHTSFLDSKTNDEQCGCFVS